MSCWRISIKVRQNCPRILLYNCRAMCRSRYTPFVLSYRATRCLCFLVNFFNTCRTHICERIWKCSLFVCFLAAFGGMQPLGRSPMRSSRRSLSYTSIKAVIDNVSNHFSVRNAGSFEQEGFDKDCRNLLRKQDQKVISLKACRVGWKRSWKNFSRDADFRKSLAE